MKVCAVVISGAAPGENVKELEIRPGSTAGDALRALGLGDGYVLSKEGSGHGFAAEEDLFAQVEDGQKLRATPIAEVGMGLKRFVFRAKSVIFGPPLVSIRTPFPRSNGDGRVVVGADDRPVWQIKNWKRDGNWLHGAYRLSNLRSFAGSIDISDPYRPEFYITSPPASVLEGDHAACFRKRGDGRFFVHFGLSNPSIDAGVVAVEKLLAQALNPK
jgi:hypothetical protein